MDQERDKHVIRRASIVGFVVALVALVAVLSWPGVLDRVWPPTSADAPWIGAGLPLGVILTLCFWAWQLARDRRRR